MDTLDKIIDIATKANSAVNIISPGAGTIGSLGLGLAKFIVNKINQTRRDADLPLIELPSDDVLIARMEQRANRIVDKGEDFLGRD